MIKAITGSPALLQLQLFDGATDRFPVAYVRNSGGALVFTVPLTHVGLGLYDGFFTPVVVDYYTSTYITYLDAPHTLEDFYYEYAEDIFGAEAPPIPFPTVEDIADGVWDEIMTDHSISHTFGIHFQVIRQFSENTDYEIISSLHGLEAIMANVTNQGVLDRIEIDANEVKIDAIIPAVNAARDAVITQIDENQLLIQGLDSHLTNVDNHLTNEINQNEVKIDQTMAMISTIQNNTTTRFIVPEQLMRPDSGNKHYQFHLRLFDTMGNAEAPDSTPTIRIRNLETGLDIVNTAMTQDGVKVGAYFYEYVISSGALLEHFLVEATVIENGSTRYIPAVTEITEFQADLTAILNAVNDVDNIVTQNQNLLNNPVFGLNALHNENTSISNDLVVIDNEIDHITAVVDAIPTNLATKPDVLDVYYAVLNLPTIIDIQNALEFLRQQIMGIDNRTATEVYDKIDFTGLLQTNDPRLNYLDASISSRSTLTANEVWTYVTRTLTSLTIPVSEFEKVWDVLTTQITVPNSIGRYILDMLNFPTGSLATVAQVQALLVGVAQEISVQQALALIQQDITQGQICCTNLTNLLTLIKAKTDNIPVDPATEGNVDNTRIQILSVLATIDLILDAMKVYTDRIPLLPATEQSVLAIPTNPVLATDPRLAFLDAFISSRATPISITGLATTADVNNAMNVVVSEVNQNEVKIDNIQLSVNQLPLTSYFNSKFSQVSTAIALENAKNEILNAIGTEAGLTAAEVWSYVTRTLTEPFPDISNLATKDDVKHNIYTTKFSTTYRTATDDQELIVWAEKDGQRFTASTNCVVTIKDSSGATVWGASVTNPNADGVYRFIHSISVVPDNNYYIVITVNADDEVRSTQQAFFTIGC